MPGAGNSVVWRVAGRGTQSLYLARTAAMATRKRSLMKVCKSPIAAFNSAARANSSDQRVHRHRGAVALDLPVGQGRASGRRREPRAGRTAHQHGGPELLVERLDARGDVDGIADEGVRQALAAADVAGDDGAGVDADAVVQLAPAGRSPPGVPRGEPARMARAAATAASAWSGRATGAPNTASISSPMNWSTSPPHSRIAPSISPK